MRERQALAYDPRLEVRYHQQASTREARKRASAYSERQAETFLAERLNTLLSETRYEIREGRIYGQNMDEPFLDSIARGVNYRAKIEDSVDKEREKAELTGFAKTEAFFLSKDARAGDMILSISGKGEEGSIYQHNFYDIFTLKQDEDGAHIEARRYSCGLTREEVAAKLRQAYLLKTYKTPTAEEFLENPIEINPQNFFLKDAESVHSFLHKEHKYTTKEEFDAGIRAVGFIMTSYVNALAEGLEEYEINLRLNALINGFDIVMGLSNERFGRLKPYDLSRMINSRESIRYLGMQAVRQTTTGCGFSGGYNIGSGQSGSAPFSVSEFGNLGEDKYGKMNFDCPDCKKTNTRPKDELLPKCRHCGSKNVAC